MDKKDLKILEVLEENSKMSTRQLSNVLSLPMTTVHNRIKRMERKGIIKSYSLRLDYRKLGKPLTAFVLVSADLELLKKLKRTQRILAKEVRGISNVENVKIILGVADLIVKLRLRDIDELDEVLFKKIQIIDGVSDTQTLIVMSEFD